MKNLYTPSCLMNIPRQKSRTAETKRKKKVREIGELAVIECIQRLKAERRSKPKDWDRGYNSAITALELFKDEISNRAWAPIEGPVVNQQLTTEDQISCACAPGGGCTNCTSQQRSNDR
ncbi:conserved protein of unknown function [Pseudomonas marincola]|uniref:Uncharacterized protein n=1 Tax=Pseudomonas marincola TaxID=437900 RepID=A0A653E7W2_9PSED|nr:hypothetical protein [Pseudomonas marincola]CAE6905915.1 conserved protein of unknown function [Pseudomonas marincola]